MLNWLKLLFGAFNKNITVWVKDTDKEWEPIMKLRLDQIAHAPSSSEFINGIRSHVKITVD